MPARLWDRGDRGFYVRVFENGRRRAFRVAPPGDAGKEHALQVIDALNLRTEHANLWADPFGKPLPLNEVLEGWLEVHGKLLSARTQRTNRALVNRLIDHFGSKDLRELRDLDVRRFAAETVATRSGHVAANALSLLRRVLNLAVEDQLIPRNLCPAISKVMGEAKRQTSKGETTRDAWTMGERDKILALAAQSSRELELGLYVAFYTGMRRGEILALQWSDIDFERGMVHVRRAASGKGSGTKLPKAGRGRRLPLAPTLRRELARERLRRIPAPEWVVASPTGIFWQERNFSRAWEDLRAKFGPKKVRPLALHSTRHSFITWLLEAGISSKAVSEMVGASVSVIEQHYAHVLPGERSLECLEGSGTKLEPSGTKAALSGLGDAS